MNKKVPSPASLSICIRMYTYIYGALGEKTTETYMLRTTPLPVIMDTNYRMTAKRDEDGVVIIKRRKTPLLGRIQNQNSNDRRALKILDSCNENFGAIGILSREKRYPMIRENFRNCLWTMYEECMHAFVQRYLR